MKKALKVSLVVASVLALSAATVACDGTEETEQSQPEATTYTVTYTLNGGTGAAPTQEAMAEGATFTLASAEGFSYSGYTFDGWSDGAVKYNAGAEFTMPAHNVTFTAQWDDVDNGDSGDSGDGEDGGNDNNGDDGDGDSGDDGDGDSGDSGDNGDGDDGDSDDNGDSGDNGDGDDNNGEGDDNNGEGGDVPAVGAPTVTLDANGGTGAAPTVTVTKSGDYYKVTLPTCTYTAPTGKKFLAWQYDGAQYDEGDSTITLRPGASITVKALWTNDNSLSDAELDGAAYLGTLTLLESINSNYGNYVEYVKLVVSEDMSAATFYYYEKTDWDEYAENATLKYKTIGFDTHETEENTFDPNGEVRYIRMGNNIGHFIMFNADKTQFKICNSNGAYYSYYGEDHKGDAVFYKGDADSGYVDFTVKDMVDLQGKQFVAEENFICGGVEFIGIQFEVNSLGAVVLKTIYMSNGAEKVLTTSISFNGVDSSDGYLWTFNSSSYDITVGKKADGNLYIASFRYKTGSISEQPIQLTERV